MEFKAYEAAHGLSLATLFVGRRFLPAWASCRCISSQHPKKCPGGFPPWTSPLNIPKDAQPEFLAGVLLSTIPKMSNRTSCLGISSQQRQRWPGGLPAWASPLNISKNAQADFLPGHFLSTSQKMPRRTSCLGISCQHPKRCPGELPAWASPLNIPKDTQTNFLPGHFLSTSPKMPRRTSCLGISSQHPQRCPGGLPAWASHIHGLCLLGLAAAALEAHLIVDKTCFNWLFISYLFSFYFYKNLSAPLRIDEKSSLRNAVGFSVEP